MARRLHAPEAQPVTFVELFFDLVFVFAVTQITVLTAHHLDWGGIGRSTALFWLIWWAWTQFTWTLNPADTQHPFVQALTLAATGAAFVMAASVPRAFESDPFWFAVPYVAIRLIGLGLQVRVDQERDGSRPGMSMRWVTASLLGLALVLVGAAVDPDLRVWVWLAAIAADLFAAALAAGNAEWDLNPAHFSERHGLFVIIALGESLIVAGSAVAEDERSLDLILTAGAALVVVCLLWWTYFGWLKDALEHHLAAAAPADLGPLCRDAFSLVHFPLIGGIIAFAVAVEEVMLHPERAADATVIASLAVGIGLFVGSSALAYWRLSGKVLVDRLTITAATIAAVVALGSADPAIPFTAAAVGLLGLVVVEERSHPRAPSAAVEVE